MAILDEAERQAIAAEAGYDLALRFALEGLRRAEGGGPQKPNPHEDWKPRKENPFVGGEFGVQTMAAATFAQQVRVAATSILNTEARYGAWMLKQAGDGEPEKAQRPRERNGLHAEKFLRWFSGRWAPASDPRNKTHARDLVDGYAAAIRRYDAGGPGPPAASAREAA